MKSLLIDVLNVVLVRKEGQNDIVCKQVLELLELLIKQGVPVYAVSVVPADQWGLLEREYPFLKSHFQDVMFLNGAVDDAKSRVLEVKTFLERQGVTESDALYVFDSSVLTDEVSEEFYDSFSDCSQIEPNFYHYQEVTPHWLKCRLVAEKVLYQSARSTEITLNSNERELCGILIMYIALARCRQFVEWSFDEFEEMFPEESRPCRWEQSVQFKGCRGALITTEGYTVFELAITCLEQFDLIDEIVGRFYKMRENVVDIPRIIRTRQDLNREHLALAVEVFFDYEMQRSWSCTKEYRENFPARMVEISTKIIDAFQANRLIEEKDGSLFWSEKMDPYFTMTLRGEPVVRKMGHEEAREEASEFFARICIQTDGTLH